jgi:hypothetical protein
MLSNVLFILLGAGLVAVGFLTAALAERIRNPPGSHISPEAVLLTPPLSREPPRVSRPETRVPPSPGEDVVAALMTAGYKRPVATEATWACSPSERETLESWTASALRRCVRGGLT